MGMEVVSAAASITQGLGVALLRTLYRRMPHECPITSSPDVRDNDKMW